MGLPVKGVTGFISATAFLAKTRAWVFDSRCTRSIRMSVTSSLSASRCDARDDVGAVFLVGQRLGLGVGGLFRERVDGGAAGFGAAHRVGMDGDEQIGLVFPRDADPVPERQEPVVRAGHDDVDVAGGFEDLLQLQPIGQHHVLLPASCGSRWRRDRCRRGRDRSPRGGGRQAVCGQAAPPAGPWPRCPGGAWASGPLLAPLRRWPRARRVHRP